MFEDLTTGVTLQDLLNSDEKSSHIEWSEAVHMIRQLLEGVANMHDKRVVHRNLKPSNILCAIGPDKKRQIVITDFDLAFDARPGNEMDACGRGASRRLK